MPRPKIITNHVFPPIPDRRFDWLAYHDGDGEFGPVGYGRTEEEAIRDLKNAHFGRVTPFERLQVWKATRNSIGGPPDRESADIRFRADMINAGRGHLLR